MYAAVSYFYAISMLLHVLESSQFLPRINGGSILLCSLALQNMSGAVNEIRNRLQGPLHKTLALGVQCARCLIFWWSVTCVKPSPMTPDRYTTKSVNMTAYGLIQETSSRSLGTIFRIIFECVELTTSQRWHWHVATSLDLLRCFAPLCAKQQNGWIPHQGAANGHALLLSSRQTRSTRTHLCLPALRLTELAWTSSMWHQFDIIKSGHPSCPFSSVLRCPCLVIVNEIQICHLLTFF